MDPGEYMPSKVCLLICAITLFSAHKTARAELEPSCAKDSPERRGDIGCSYIEDKVLPAPLKEPLFWHIDRFESNSDAQAAAGPNSVVFQAHGAWWAMSIEPMIKEHHGGKHVASIALPPLPPAPKYSMLVISAYIPAGQTSRVHHHSGVEAFFTVDGEQCLETPTAAHRIPKGSGFAVPAGLTMRLVATGSKPRRGLAVIVYDASQPPTTRTEELASELVLCRP